MSAPAVVFYCGLLDQFEAEYAVETKSRERRGFLAPRTAQVHDKDWLSPRTSMAYSTRFGEETRMCILVLLCPSMSCHAGLSRRDETFTDKSILPTQQ